MILNFCKEQGTGNVFRGTDFEFQVNFLVTSHKMSGILCICKLLKFWPYTAAVLEHGIWSVLFHRHTPNQQLLNIYYSEPTIRKLHGLVVRAIAC